MNPNQTNALMVKHYDNTYQVCTDLGAYVRANAPDDKARDKARITLIEHSDMQYPRDMLYYLHGAFDELSERSYYKVAGRDVPKYDKLMARADFYHCIALWANASYDLVKESPVIAPVDSPKDAEDDSDPYVRPSPKDTLMETALAALQERLTLADFGKRRIDSAVALFKSVVLWRPSGATVLDVLERFGDEASELSWGGEYNAAAFWDACVQISDDLRSDMAADQIEKASTVTVPEHETAGAMWEVAGDPDRSLFRTKLEAERAAREIFPDENVSQRYARVQYRNIVNFK